MNAKKPFYTRWKFWKWFIIVTIALNVFGAIYNATPAGKQAAEELRMEEVAKAEAAEKRKVERAAKAEAQAAKVDAEYERAKTLADKYEKDEAKAEEEKADADVETDDAIRNALNALVESSEGVLVSIEKNPSSDDWKVMRVTVSDAWYDSPEHEKERFAETVGATVKAAIGGEEYKTVNFYDSFGKVVASEKMTGGYKIKR